MVTDFTVCAVILKENPRIRMSRATEIIFIFIILCFTRGDHRVIKKRLKPILPLPRCSTNTSSGSAERKRLNNLPSLRTQSFDNSFLKNATGTFRSVSYTHLRAHETGRNLVCRLLL